MRGTCLKELYRVEVARGWGDLLGSRASLAHSFTLEEIRSQQRISSLVLAEIV